MDLKFTTAGDYMKATQKRIGFACKYMHPDQTQKKKLLEEIQRPLNTRSTTVQWLNRQTRDVAEERLWDIMVHNIQSYYNLIEYVGGLPNELRMIRLGSDVLPVYTEPTWSYYWKHADVRRYCEDKFARVGELARHLDVRLSFHPSQFVVFGSESEDIVDRSIQEFEYHADIARWMGYGKNFQDFKCNIHVSGRKGVEGVRQVLNRLTPEARNIITFENDEFSTGIDDLIKLADEAALVFDNHHHWIHSGEHLTPDDDRYKKILDSWRGVRPTMHYSVSREEYLTDTDTNQFPDMNKLLSNGYKRGKLRAHSDYYTNTALNNLIYEFWQYSDIMCESKMKGLASSRLYDYFMQKHI